MYMPLHASMHIAPISARIYIQIHTDTCILTVKRSFYVYAYVCMHARVYICICIRM